MLLVALGAVGVMGLTGQASPAPKTFAEIEKAKYEAFSKLEKFSGHYDVVLLPASQRQSIYLTLDSTGRRVKVVVDGNTVVESAWTKDQKWLVNHVTAQYSLEDKPGAVTLVEPYKALKTEKGRANFAVADMGPRFNADPEPTIESDSEVTEDGKTLRRIQASSKNADTDGVVTITELFDKGTFITRRFTMEIVSKGKTIWRADGFLRDDKKGDLGTKPFAMPNGVVGTFSKVGG